uniref:Pre-mRNA-splicing factor 38 n=1 Tax=Meloidogyne javanica TaxID=6303 RepID=A0A915MK84_MELJA
MANRTSRDAHTVKGTNPQYLIEKIIRTRIYDSIYWKEQCFGLSAPFLCLTLKLLQLQPEKDIVIEFIRQDDFKYIRALGAMYIRLTFNSVEVYKYLEPLYNDYRKLRYMNRMGKFELLYMDDFIDNLMREDHYCDIQLPRLQKRQALEETDQLEVYQSALDEDLERLSSSEDSEDERDRRRRSRPSIVSRRRSRTRSRSREHNSSRSYANQEREIEESNAMRKKLGLAPLER